MEYGILLAMLLAVVAVCSYQIRRLGAVDRTARRTAPNKAEEVAPGAGNARDLLRHDVENVPIPWGWPGSEGHHQSIAAAGEADSSGSTLQRWVDHLVSEKQTHHGAAYQQRRAASMRALLEDRFHSTHANGAEFGGAPNAATEHHKPSPVEKSGVKLAAPAASSASAAGHTNLAGEDTLSDVKTPWGW